MENSVNSTGKAPSARPEESSWTMYFDDFLLHNTASEHRQHTCFSSGCETSSLISDAGSSVANKNLAAQHNNDHEVNVGLSVDRGCSRLSFKKRKTKAAPVHDAVVLDDALEDTATSPVNSPKVCNTLISQLETKPKERGNVDMSRERGNSSGHKNERSDQVKRESDYTELKKKETRKMKELKSLRYIQAGQDYNSSCTGYFHAWPVLDTLVHCKEMIRITC